MPGVVPEKRQLEDHVHAAVGAQFWGQGIENSRCLSGQAVTAPTEPQPLRLTAPSGLSRSQFLVASRATRLPIFPGYCEQHGGTVVDRVLLQSGAQKWWAALIGRAKLQQGWNQHTTTTLRDNLSDPDNYALAATGRLQLADNTVFKATLQSDSLTALQPLLPQTDRWQQSWFSSSSLHLPGRQQQQRRRQRGGSTGATSSSSGSSRLVRLVQGNSLSMQLKQQLEGMELTADLAMNEMAVEGVTRYTTVPLRLSLDIAPSTSLTKKLRLRPGNSNSGSSSSSSSAADSSSSNSASSSGSAAGVDSSGGSGSSLQGLLFRAGLHGVVAPWDDAGGQPSTSAAARTEQPQQHTSKSHQQQHRLSVHAQGTLALAGTKTLWEAGKKPWQAAADAAAAAKRRHKKQQAAAAELTVAPLQGVKEAENTASSSSKQHGADGSKDSSSSGKGSSSRQQRGSKGSSTRHSSGSRSKPRVLTLQGHEIQLPLANPGSVQESLQEASSKLERLRTDLRSWQGRVEAGGLQDLSSARKSGGLLSSAAPGGCWSAFIPPPHFKVSGLIGLLGRVPLQQQMLLLPAASGSHRRRQPSRDSSFASLGDSTAGAAAGAGSSQPGSSRLKPEGGRPLTHKARDALAASATHLDRLVVGSARKLGHSIANESLVRLFGSAGFSGQLGGMRSNWLDFSRLEAVLDLGLNGPEALPGPAAPAAAAGGSSSKGMLRVPSTARGLASILGPAAAASAAAAQPLALPPSLLVGGSSNGSPRSSTIGSSSAAAAGSPGATAGAAKPPASAQQQLASAPATPKAAAAAAGAAGKHKHPAFALEERGVWHALTLSATQQLVGPVRLRADWRLALDSVQPCPRGAGLLQPSAPLQLLRHVAGVRPALVDAAYGVDVVVPGGGGLVRLVGWYNPGRGEGGLGLRLM